MLSSANSKSARSSDRDRSLPQIPPDQGSSGRAGHSPVTSMSYASAGAEADGAPPAKQYSNLDLIKADTPHTTAKISRMLHQLEFKLQVEMQYKKGIDKMVKLYQADGDKKSRADAESKRVESEKKIQLLQSALKRYKNLHILDDVDDEEQPQGIVTITIHGELWTNVAAQGSMGIAKTIFGENRFPERYSSQSKLRAN